MQYWVPALQKAALYILCFLLVYERKDEEKIEVRVDRIDLNKRE